MLKLSPPLQFVESGFGERLVTFSVGEGRGRRLVVGWKADFDRRAKEKGEGAVSALTMVYKGRSLCLGTEMTAVTV